MIFTALVVVFGLVTRQPRRYWLFGAAAVSIHLLASFVFAAVAPVLVVGWGVPTWLVVRGHAKRNVTLATRAVRQALAKKILGAHVVGLIVQSENGRLAVGLDDSVVGWKLREHGEYGFDEIDRLKKYLTADSGALIVGAHVGSVAVPLSKVCKKVVAIEADPDTYRLLTTNLVLNEVSNCRPINIAASDREERLEFIVDPTNSGGNKRVPKTRDPMYYSSHSAVISVNAFALDDYLDDFAFDLVLMDIEGSEYFALRGMTKILERCRVLVVEFLPHHLKNVSGVAVEEFLSVIPPRFRTLTIPSKGLTVGAPEFVTVLQDMFVRDQGDEGIIFEAA